MSNLSTVILAAGNSTRFKGKKSKLLYPLSGLPIINHVVNVAKKISGKNIIIVCNKNNLKLLKDIVVGCTFVIQKKQKGTADAIKSARSKIKTKDFIVLFGDVPLINNAIIKKLINHHNKNNTYGSMIAFNTNNPYGYGRVILNGKFISKVVEEINCTNEEKNINLCNSGIMIVNSKFFFDKLKLIKINKKKNERYLPDIFKIYFFSKRPFSFIISEENIMLGVNTLDDLNKVEKIFQSKMIEKLNKKGVIVRNPETCYINFDTVVEKNVIIESNVSLNKNIIIKEGVTIKSHSYIEGAKIEKNCSIGPFARIRPSTHINENSKIGNFVEIKNSEIGKNVSISHLSYIGDSKIENNVNIGAGTITCNFDGKRKNKTIIKEGSFIGSNSSLIAPVTINKNAKIAAGSVITEDIPSNNLAIERSKLKIIKKK